MNYLKKLLSSRAIQGVLITLGGALVKFAESAFPEYAKVIDLISVAMITGGSVHGIYGRILAAGPIIADAALATIKVAAPQYAALATVALTEAEKIAARALAAQAAQQNSVASNLPPSAQNPPPPPVKG